MDHKLNDFRPGIIQPGMEQVIEVGDTLEITDNHGQVFAVTAKLDPRTLAFMAAFDTWLTWKQQDGKPGAVGNALYGDMIARFNSLPLAVQRQLPSFKLLGLQV